jgi:hypothetical protein
MRSGSLRPFVPVALRWVSSRGLGVESAPTRERSETPMPDQAQTAAHIEAGLTTTRLRLNRMEPTQGKLARLLSPVLSVD